MKNLVTQFEKNVIGPSTTFNRGLEIIVDKAAGSVVSDFIRNVKLGSYFE
jgi:hypothetical protein